jgi:hypothetical protein
MRQRALVVPDKTERVLRFHQNTLQALKELVQAAGLAHPGQITASHIVRRVANHEVRLLANQLTFVQPGSLLAAIEGPWPGPTALLRPAARWLRSRRARPAQAAGGAESTKLGRVASLS